MGPLAIQFLTKIFNLCIEEDTWIWNKSHICFIKKAGKPSYMEPGAYRPLTISSYVGKLLERVIENRLKEFCNSNNILDNAQEGFRSKRSTTRYLYRLTASLHEARMKKLVSMVLFIDFEKAFDSVWIPGLIVKLNRHGIKGKLLRIISTYLSGRIMSLRINSYFGRDRHCLEYGLPQGSVLSPLLFIIYIADLLHYPHLPTEAAK